MSRVYTLDLRCGTRVAVSFFRSRERVGVFVGISTPIGSLFALFLHTLNILPLSIVRSPFVGCLFRISGFRLHRLGFTPSLIFASFCVLIV